MATITELAAQLLALRSEKEQLEAKLKELSARAGLVEKELSERMVEQGVQSITMADGQKVYLSRELAVSIPAQNQPAVADVCTELGLGDLVRTEVSTQRLKARVREWLGDLGAVEALPEQLRSLVHIHEWFAVRVRKS